MKNLILSLFFFVPIFGFSQWSQVNIGTSQDLYSVDYHSTNDIWIGSFNLFAKTANGGTNWSVVTLLDGNSANLAPANLYDVELITAAEAIGTGFFYLGNTELILHTVNAGTTWPYDIINNVTAHPRYIRSVDQNGSNLLASGNSGRMFRSTNNGGSWTLISTGTTAMLNDVKFLNTSTAYSAGTNLMLRSTDGGLTWTSTVVSGDYRMLSCSGSVVYAAEEYGAVIKSTNNGVTYTTLTTPFVARTGIVCLNEDTVIVSATDGMYISRDGGLAWEKYQLASYQPIRMFDFLNSTNAYAVGLSGFVLKTSNINAAPTLPVVDFNITGSPNYCLGTTINLNNETANLAGYTFDWKMDGVTFATTYNASYNLTVAGAHTITLTVTNSFGSTTATQNITVVGYSVQAFTVNTEDSVCVGNYNGFQIPVSQTGTSYQLRKGSVNVGTAQSGNGGILNFSSVTGVSVTTNFNIKATRTNVCFTDTLSVFKTVVAVPNPALPVSACMPASQSPTYQTYDPGISHFSLGDIDNYSTHMHNHYYTFVCCEHTDLVMGNTYPMSITVNQPAGEYVTIWIDKNNSGTFDVPSEVVYDAFVNGTVTANITVPTTSTFNQIVRMRVASDVSSSSLDNACFDYYIGEIEDYAVTILPAPVAPVSGFTFSVNESCTTVATFSNTTYNGVGYTWDFGDGTPVSNLMNPTHEYSLSGTYTITLTSTNPYGSDVETQNITIVIPDVPIAACTPLTISGSCSSNPNSRPTIESIQQAPSGTDYWTNSVTYDYTCDIQYNLESDSVYTFYIDLTYGGYFVAYLDANNNGVFEQVEGLGPDGAHTQNYGFSGSGTNYAQFNIPAFAEDSMPLRLRMYSATSYTGYQTLCNNFCGDYKDITVFLTSPELDAKFTAFSTNLCVGDSVYLNLINSSRDDVAWLWDFGDGDFSTSKDPDHYYTAPGTYTVKLTVWDQDGNIDSLVRTNYITVLPGLTNPVVQRSGTTLYTLTSANSYQWYRNNVLISGATDSLYVATLDGTYKVTATIANGCSATSANFSYYPPHVNFNPSPTTACVNANVFLNNASTNCTSYTIDWGDGTPLVNFTTGGPFHPYANAGVYTVKLIGCGALGCDSLIRLNYITINPLPTMPVISYVNPNLVCASGYTTYQWYRNAVLISGATSNTYLPTLTGNYTVKVTNAGGCNITSAAYAHFPINVNFNTSITGFCGVTSANVPFTNTTTNATSYEWDFGDGNTSTATSPTHNYSTAGIFTVKLVACGASSCDSLIRTNYITIDPVAFDVTVSQVNDTIFCYGNTFPIQASAGSGATYQWLDNGTDMIGETDSILFVANTGTFSVEATNASGCVVTSAGVFIDADYYCVWPGDTDFSYYVDNYDYLQLGLAYGLTGPPRYSISNSWNGFAATDWGINSLWVDAKHADSNGDGIVDDADTLGVHLNFTNIHNVTSGDESRSADPNLYCTTSSMIYEAGDWVDIDIYVGSATEQVTDLYGLAFNISADLDKVEPGTATMIYSDCWLTDLGTDGLTFGKPIYPDNTVYDAVTRTSHTGKSGNGKLGTFRFQVSNSIVISESMTINITQAYAVTPTEAYVPLELNFPLYLSLEPSSTLPTTADFFATPNGFCGVTNATVSFSNSSIDATYYIWDFGDGNTSTDVNPVHYYANPGTYSVQLIACDSYCDTLTLINYITIDPIPFTVTTSIGDTMICNGETVEIFSSSATSYQWLESGVPINGEINSSFTTGNIGYYNVEAINAVGCQSASNTIFIDLDMDCVWPGDTDGDVQVDNHDILQLGLNYGYSGFPREIISNSWTPFAVADWGQISLGKDIKHADCNGDGVIDFSDSLAIHLNFFSDHSFTTDLNVNSTDPHLFLSTAASTYEVGDWVDVQVNLGSASEPVSDFYGIAFDIDLDYSLIEPGSASLHFNNSWLTDNATDGISFGKIEETDGKACIGLTRISHTGKSGNGNLALLRFQVNNSLTINQTLTMSISGHHAVDANGDTIHLQSDFPLDLNFTTISVGNIEGAIEWMDVYPVPFENSLFLEFELKSSENVTIKITDALGKEIIKYDLGELNGGKHYFELFEGRIQLASGIYFLQMQAGDSKMLKKVICNN